jgi:hypothetical protein
MSSLLHESGAQKEGIIRHETAFRSQSSAMIISGPMLYVGNPLYKTPNAVCRTWADYEVVDLLQAGDDYTPRTNYAPAVAVQKYAQQLPRCSWDPTKGHVDSYRVAFRRRVALNGERSLISAIIPPGIAHVDAVESVTLRESSPLLSVWHFGYQSCSIFS